MIENLKNLMSNVTIIDGVIVVLVILVVIFLREKKVVKDVFVSVILEAEKRFNSGEGQLKLAYAIEKIKASELPFLIKICLTKRLIVTLIEYLLNSLSKFMKLETEIDLLGNETSKTDIIKDINVDLNKEKASVGVEMSVGEKPTSNKSDNYIYGKVEAKTDFRGKDDARVEIGIVKKF